MLATSIYIYSQSALEKNHNIIFPCLQVLLVFTVDLSVTWFKELVGSWKINIFVLRKYD